mmetsp:Transcript_10690/g.23577  ORF Transcript_10690/g.23577 Transcript_10690/m.23577 type:complete len:201 (+) Transcript_10690:541-1143(+)
MVSLGAKWAFHLLRVGLLTIVADDDWNFTLLHCASLRTSVDSPWLPAYRTPTLDVLLQVFMRFKFGNLLEPTIEQIVPALPEPAFREGLHVPLDAPSAMVNALCFELVRVFLDLVHQCSGPFAPNASGAIHHDLFPLKLLFRLWGIEPSRELEAVSDRRNDELRSTLWRLEVAYGRLVNISNVDNHRIWIGHHFVVFVSL